MPIDDPIARLLNLFAGLLEYPTPALTRQAATGVEWLAELQPQAAARLDLFQRGVAEMSTGRIEEIYTRTFDMQPVSYPYVGYHLFGESYKRGAFMAQLNEGYRAVGFSAGKELPDHVAVILRFLASSVAARTGEFGRTLIEDGLTPTLEKMVRELDAPADNPYAALVSALLLVLMECMDTPPGCNALMNCTVPALENADKEKTHV